MTRGDVLRYRIAFALSRAAKIVRGLRQAVTKAERYAVADHVVEQLKERGDPWQLSHDADPNNGTPTTAVYVQCMPKKQIQMETFMNMKLIIAILAIAVVPVCAKAQQPSGATVKTDVQNVVKMISGDKAKTQTYCQIDELSDQITQAAQKKDNKKVEELSRKMEELEGSLGPEYVALANELEEVDPNSQDGQEISSAIDALDRLCAH
jgi:hypothetical protein